MLSLLGILQYPTALPLTLWRKCIFELLKIAQGKKMQAEQRAISFGIRRANISAVVTAVVSGHVGELACYSFVRTFLI